MNKSVIKLTMLVVVVVGIGCMEMLFDIGSFFTQDNLVRLLERVGSTAPLVFILIMACAVVISPIPSLPLDIAAGVFFGPFLGTLYAAIGALIGAVISFFIARSLGQEMVAKLFRGHILVCRKCTNNLMTKIVFFSRLIPFISFDIVSYGAGLTKMSVLRFSLATFVGMLPLTFLYTYFGSVLIINQWVGLGLGVVVVGLFFLVPRLIETRNLFNLKKYFQHS